MRVEWDPNKNKLNIKKHKISFEEASLVFADPNALSIFDEKHSEREDRWITIGAVTSGNLLVVIHTDSLKNAIRIISARKATKNESSQYLSASKGK
jgi:uncharacterized protein